MPTWGAAVASFPPLLAQCASPNVTARFVHDVIAPRPEAEGSTTLRTLVAGVLDASARNGWGRTGRIFAVAGDDPVGMVLREAPASSSSPPASWSTCRQDSCSVAGRGE